MGTIMTKKKQKYSSVGGFSIQLPHLLIITPPFAMLEKFKVVLGSMGADHVG